ncbi:MAG: helix-turn-helix transcriptional regulator [Clostridia bacterium]|nr:helix-turn-helix transcriptional regulator [Clostridia bacterium]
MLFGEKLKALRLERGYTQEQLAQKVDVTKRTLINYEQGRCYPKQTEILARLAQEFDVTVDYLMSDEDRYIQDAQEKGGIRAAQDVQALLTNARAMFAGGELSEEDKDKVMRKLNELYWDAKESNRRRAKQ